MFVCLICYRSWSTLKGYIHGHREFDVYFVEVCDEGDSWKQTPAFIDNYEENRIPFDLLHSSEAESCYRNHYNNLRALNRKNL